MKVFPDKLEAALAKRLPPVVLVSGDEPLIHMEACDAVRRVARERGIEEREVLHVESGFQWTQLLESAASLSLFASSKLIEVRLGGQSPGQEGGKALEAYAEKAGDSDNVLCSAPSGWIARHSRASGSRRSIRSACSYRCGRWIINAWASGCATAPRATG